MKVCGRFLVHLEPYFAAHIVNCLSLVRWQHKHLDKVLGPFQRQHQRLGRVPSQLEKAHKLASQDCKAACITVSG